MMTNTVSMSSFGMKQSLQLIVPIPNLVDLSQWCWYYSVAAVVSHLDSEDALYSSIDHDTASLGLMTIDAAVSAVVDIADQPLTPVSWSPPSKELSSATLK
jgi:hypothetical protein